MPTIIGVRFRDAGKVYYFDPKDYEIRYHDHVIVETSRGIEYGTVVISPTEIAEDKVPAELRQVLRVATEEDNAHEKENRQKEAEALKVCKQKAAERGLEMKLIAAEYTFDNSKIYFYFTADGRVDFRELVRDLVGIFRTRIELRQIGVRDETKILGGIGSCGRPLCCHTWLSEFAPVSIKMAKDQNLSLNPTKISGCCGRLMCCLKNEAETYAELNKGLPNKGDYVTTPDGLHGDVHSVNILRQTVKVIVEMDNDEKELQEFHISDITFIPKSKKPKKDTAGKDAAAKGKDAAGRGGKDERKTRDGAGRKEDAARKDDTGRKDDTQRPGSEERQDGADRKSRRNRREHGRRRDGGAADTGADGGASSAGGGAAAQADSVAAVSGDGAADASGQNSERTGERKRRRRRKRGGSRAGREGEHAGAGSSGTASSGGVEGSSSGGSADASGNSGGAS